MNEEKLYNVKINKQQNDTSSLWGPTRSSAQGNCSAKSQVVYVSSQLEAEI